MKYKKETKYLIFKELPNPGRKTKIISIINKSSDEEIGTIEWYSSWRQYCFMSGMMHYGTVWNNTCLADVVSVLNELMDERKVSKPKGE